MSNANWKPWWEQVATFENGNDQENFLKGVYQGLTTNRPAQRQSYLMGLVAGYRNRPFAQPKSHTGKP
jgi:hypothetical protein